MKFGRVYQEDVFVCVCVCVCVHPMWLSTSQNTGKALLNIQNELGLVGRDVASYSVNALLWCTILAGYNVTLSTSRISHETLCGDGMAWRWRCPLFFWYTTLHYQEGRAAARPRSRIPKSAISK